MEKSTVSCIVEYVKSKIIGRVADQEDGTAVMAYYAAKAGSGDHLEIGTLFGGSAIVVALAKRLMGLDGNVYCLDPLDGYYRERFGHITDVVCKEHEISPDLVMKNAKIFEVEDRIRIIQKKSLPFPDELRNHRFVSAYIDGDHWDNMPTHDWNNVKKITSKYVIFDNYDDSHPSVKKACDRALKDGWKLEYSGGITFVVSSPSL